MPAVSQAQQSIMGQAWGLRKGMLKQSDINPKYFKGIKKIATSDMTDKDLEKFASTKRKKLPHYVDEKNTLGKKQIDEKGVGMRSSGLATFTPGISPGGGIAPIVPFLNPDVQKKSSSERKKMQHLADYRDWIKNNK